MQIWKYTLLVISLTQGTVFSMEKSVGTLSLSATERAPLLLSNSQDQSALEGVHTPTLDWLIHQTAVHLKHIRPVTSAVFSPDGESVLTAGLEGIQIFNSHTGMLWDTVPQGSSSDKALYSPLAEQLATIDCDKVLLWGGTFFYGIQRKLEHQKTITALAFHPSKNLLVSADHTGVINEWDAGTGELLKSWQCHNGRIESLIFDRNGALMSASNDGAIVRLDWQDKTFLQIKESGQSFMARTVAFSFDGRYCFYAIDNQVIKADIQEQSATLFGTYQSELSRIAVDQAGKIVVLGFDSGLVSVHDLATGVHIFSISDAHKDRIFSLALHRQRLVTASRDGNVRVWDLALIDFYRQEVAQTENHVVNLICQAATSGRKLNLSADVQLLAAYKSLPEGVKRGLTRFVQLPWAEQEQ